MRKFFDDIFDRIDELIVECDEELARRFPFWAAAPDWLKYVISLIAPFTILLVGTMALDLCVIMHDFAVYILYHPQLLQAVTIVVLAFAILLSEIQRRGVIVTAIWTVVLLLLLKYVTEQVGVDTKYIDTILKTIVDVPRIISEYVVLFVKFFG